MAGNKTLHAAHLAKNDEFYTQYIDINNELCNYAHHFKGKTVFCNCDDPEWSNFWKYFVENFNNFGLKKLISTHYEPDGSPSYKMEYTGQTMNGQQVWVKTALEGNGDFRSEECINLLKEADIVVTNPPFSLFREYLGQLIEYDKRFIIIGNPNAITYREVFPLLKENRVWIGFKNMGTDMLFDTSSAYEAELRSKKKEGSGWRIVDGKFKARASAIWFTNLDIAKRHQPFFIPEDAHYYYKGNEDFYPKYDNYDAINIDKCAQIPIDYPGVMGVPISFMDKYNPEEFELLGEMVSTTVDEFNYGYPYINGKKKYARILIRHLNPIKKEDDV